MSFSVTVSDVKAGRASVVDRVLAFSERIVSSKVKDLNIFLSLNDDAVDQAKALDKRIRAGGDVGCLAGLCFVVKANIAVQGLSSNCASQVLEGFVSSFTATAVSKLLSEDAVLLGVVNMDEFACGASGETSFFGPTKNPRDPSLITGGSSSGSAAAVAANVCDFSLGSDTGGSIRNPASHCGVVGFKPSYGSVSRYGLIDLSMSLDCIGPFALSSSDAKLVFDVMSGSDNFDQTTVDVKPSGTDVKTVGLVDVEGFCDSKIASQINNLVESVASKNGWNVKKVSLPLGIVIQTYYILVYVEFFSATRKFDGRRFGKAIELAAGPEVQRRMIGGSLVTKAEHEGRFYHAAQRARQLVKEQFDKLFSGVDLIMLPTVPRLPHKIGENISLEEMYKYDVLTTPASLAGIPAISLPAGKVDGKDVGLQIMAPLFFEEKLFAAAKEFENA